MDMKAMQGQNECSEVDEARMLYVVEDDPKLLELVSVALSHPDWEIRAFTDPEAALRSFASQNPKPALLLTDYSMGTMTGLDLGRRCKELHPALKVVLMSGTAEADILDLATFDVDAFVAKPFEPRTLVELMTSFLPE